MADWSSKLVLKSSNRSKYEFSYIICIKVKSDHRSKFSNSSNWKEEAWKNQGFNGIRTRDLREYQCDENPLAAC